MSDFRIDKITNRDGSAGTQIAGISTFSGTSGIIMPGGPTEYRGGRGRGIFAGGVPVTSSIQLIEIATTGNSTSFGNLRFQNQSPDGNMSSSTRGYYVGTFEQPANALATTMQFVIFSSQGGAIYFGDLAYGRGATGTASNSTRGLLYGGDNPDYLSVLDYITLSSTGTESSFGTVLDGVVIRGVGGAQSPTRAVWGGGGNSSMLKTIAYSTFATKGDALEFGGLTGLRSDSQGASNATRGLFAGGKTPGILSSIDYVTMASTGDALDFGDLTQGRRNHAGMSNSVRGVFAAGCTTGSGPSGNVNTIDYVTIASLGNATDFGDATAAARLWNSGNSDSHGGLG